MPVRLVVATPTIREIVAAYAVATSPEDGQAGAPMVLFEHYLDSEGHEWLDPHDRRIHQRHAGASTFGIFTQLFGRDHIVPGLRRFLLACLGHDALALLHADDGIPAGVARFATWLGKEGHIDRKEAAEITRLAVRSEQLLLQAERALKQFRSALGRYDALDVEDDRLEMGDFVVVRKRRGTVWLQDRWERRDLYGPVTAPAGAMKLIEEGWTVAGSLLRERGRLRLVQVRRVFPVLEP